MEGHLCVDAQGCISEVHPQLVPYALLSFLFMSSLCHLCPQEEEEPVKPFSSRDSVTQTSTFITADDMLPESHHNFHINVQTHPVCSPEVMAVPVYAYNNHLSAQSFHYIMQNFRELERSSFQVKRSQETETESVCFFTVVKAFTTSAAGVLT